jgi:hypothetical protein
VDPGAAQNRAVDTSLLGTWTGLDTVQDGQYLRIDSLHLAVAPDTLDFQAKFTRRCQVFEAGTGKASCLAPVPSDSNLLEAKVPLGPNSSVTYGFQGYYANASAGTIVLEGSTVFGYRRFGPDSLAIRYKGVEFRGKRTR